MNKPRLDDLPGFRRRFRILPEADRVAAWVEDDFHHMMVVLHHDGERIDTLEARTFRAPWTTCPGAEQVLRDTFVGTALAQAARQRLKQANCTHLYDLAVLAAAHAAQAKPLTYDVLVSDPASQRSLAEIRRDGVSLMRWELEGFVLTRPAQLAGMGLLEMRGWIETLAPESREAAKVLQWASLIAHGRQLPLEQQSDATRMPPNCYTFQPEVARRARRVGEIIDFSSSQREPLETT